MHYDDWNGGGWWWWIPMTLMMIAFWGGLIWLVVFLVRHTGSTPSTHQPQQINRDNDPARVLDERLARGEIDIEDYRQRVAALHERNRAT